MLFIPTPEQKTAIADKLTSQSIISCAGSGKTATAVRRMVEVRRRMTDRRGYVALLSHSNTAVDTFRAEFEALVKDVPGTSGRVLIATVDSFITTHILRPHAAVLMRCACQPFLVQGGEPFLHNYKVFNGNGTYPLEIRNLSVSITATGEITFAGRGLNATATSIAPAAAEKTISRLGEVGAYTHDLARYWALRSLPAGGRLAEILARRYPYIIVDEAQDIGTMHAALLCRLQEAGTSLSLIGDPNQAIYEFADADGGFLKSFQGARGSVLRRTLSENRRSVSQIVAVGNAICGSVSRSVRPAPARKHGAYYLRYENDGLGRLIAAFDAIVTGNGYTRDESAVVCRGAALVERIANGAEKTGVGATDRFAQAAIYRDREGDIAKAFELTIHGILKLLKRPPIGFRADTLRNSSEPTSKAVRRVVWHFIKDRDHGLPSSSLLAKDQWHPLLKQRVPALLQRLEAVAQVTHSETWTRNLTVKDLPVGALWKRDLLTTDAASIRVQTVHKVKGEGIGAVLYVAKTADLKSLVAETNSEDRRIGYVAVTRARDLLVVGVPSKAPSHLVKALEDRGLVPWSATIAVAQEEKHHAKTV